MKNLTALSLVVCSLFIGVNSIAAQETSDGVTPPPKVLVIMREYLKPGKSGSLHQKTESAFIQAMTAAKWPTHYFAADSLSGPSRALFFTGYPSFEAWEKDNLATQNNATLFKALDSASVADGELLNEYDSGAFVYREELSLRASVKIAQMRYMEISRFVIRPGHEKEWEALAKIYTSGYEKAVPNAHWATFESIYGGDNGGVYLVITPMKSMTEIDRGFGDMKQFVATVGEDGMKNAAALAASCIESSQTNLFAFNPKMSYVSEEWIKADPAFWSPQ